MTEMIGDPVGEVRKHFHEELEQMELQLLTLGELAGVAVRHAVDAVLQHDDALADAPCGADARSRPDFATCMRSPPTSTMRRFRNVYEPRIAKNRRPNHITPATAPSTSPHW